MPPGAAARHQTHHDAVHQFLLPLSIRDKLRLMLEAGNEKLLKLIVSVISKRLSPSGSTAGVGFASVKMIMGTGTRGRGHTTLAWEPRLLVVNKRDGKRRVIFIVVVHVLVITGDWSRGWQDWKTVIDRNEVA